MLLELLLVVILILLFIYMKTCTMPPGLPPGSFGWPVIGDLPSRKHPMSHHFNKLRQKYGKIFMTKWGSRPVVVISDLHILKKAFNHPDLQGRNNFYSFKIFTNHSNAGLVFSVGTQWALNRRWALRVLRDLGMGKSALAVSIQDEAAMLVNHLERRNLDKPVAMDWCINVAVLNVLWQMLAGLRFETDDEKMKRFAESLDEDMAIWQGPMFVLDIFPWLIPFVPEIIYDKIIKGKQFETNRRNFRSLAQDIILDHAQKLDRSNPRDMLDFYLLEMDKEKDNPDTIFNADYNNLVIIMQDVLSAGSETTSTALRWMMLYMAIYPKVQERVHAELDREVPRDSLPSLEDRPRLPYLDATILDVLRLASLAPNGVPHMATADVQLEGYTIPKGTIVLGTLEYFHHDPTQWKKPNELYPEHFLDSEGNLDCKKDFFVTFSVGRRQCLGESLARMGLFLFTAAILHRFEITAPPGVKMNVETDPTKYIVVPPKPFKVMLKKRYT